jgi:NAD(P)-dependent dehydrogenase (short-subunit alcohol dehydrogenase family)
MREQQAQMTNDFNPMGMTGRRILVTGAASGIGRAIAILLSKLGARLVCVDSNGNGLEETGAEIDCPGHVFQLQDLNQLDAIEEWLPVIAETSGKFHGFVHAAGIPAPWPLRAVSQASWRKVFSINTEAALALAQVFERRRVRAEGPSSIVFISSVMAQVGSPASVVYSMTKAALEGMARSLALELSGKGIRVNCIAPGFVRTPMLDKVESLWDADQRARVEALHPLGFGKAVDVANAAAFLLADTARWITGTVLVVDGGYTAQ